jgi:hypothetical protein
MGMQMKLSEKNDTQAIIPTSAQKTPGFFINARTASALFAAALMIFFFSFFIGYFWGQKQAVARFSHKLDQDSFADHIYASLCGMDDGQQMVSEDQSGTDDDTLRPTMADGEQTSLQILSNQESKQETVSDSQKASSDNTTETSAQESAQVTEQESPQYYAQLAGFGTAKAAQRLSSRLQHKGIPVFVRKRNSRSARGRLLSWYQVVTERFADKAKLQELIDHVKKEERITDIHLVSC